MNVNLEIEQWKDDVMKSLQGMERAMPNPFLLTRIEAKVLNKVPVTRTQLRWATVGLIALITINIYLLSIRSEQTQTNSYSLSNFSTY